MGRSDDQKILINKITANLRRTRLFILKGVNFVTGTGQVQEQFIKFLADTPQYKNAVSSESTSNKMGDEELLAFTTEHFH